MISLVRNRFGREGFGVGVEEVVVRYPRLYKETGLRDMLKDHCHLVTVEVTCYSKLEDFYYTIPLLQHVARQPSAPGLRG